MERRLDRVSWRRAYVGMVADKEERIGIVAQGQ